MVSEEQNPVRGVVGQDFLCAVREKGRTNRKIQRSCKRYTTGGELCSATENTEADVYLNV